MTVPWTRRRLLKFWVAGVLLEALLFAVASVLFVRPDPPLVDRLQGAPPNHVVIFKRDTIGSDSPWVPPKDLGPRPDSFFTVLHWPLNKPLLEGGGRVVSMPMTMWWVPALYVGAVPLTLIAVTIWWLVARRRQPAL